jgi:hypothetical protein
MYSTTPDLSLLCPDFKALPPPGQRYNKNNPISLGRGFAGRLVIRAQDFVKAGGYNEIFDTWRGEDIDILARLDRLNMKRAAIPPKFLNAINHSAGVRFKEYPDARRYETDEIYSTTEHAHDTVVNYGRIGCGIVYRNFNDEPLCLSPMPTRIFGVGFQRTGTTSLHTALQSCGLDSGHWESATWARSIWWEMNKWGRSGTLEQFYAVCDNPVPVLYEKLDTAYPGSKFILTIRDTDAWANSVERFWTYEGNTQRWTWDEDGFSHKMHGIIYGTVDFDRTTFIARYNRHNAAVKHYFRHRPGDLLVLHVNDRLTMNPLCGFLGLAPAEDMFPIANRGTT